MMYFYKAFFKDHEVDYYALAHPIHSPKTIDPDCIKIQRINFFRFLIHYFHFKSLQALLAVV
jgi:hypothetical protein